MRENYKKDVMILILYSIGLCIFSDIIILRCLPRLISLIAGKMGYQLLSTDLLTKYCVGISVRIVGILILLFIIKRCKLNKAFTYKLRWNYFGVSWVFIVYILVNIETGDLSKAKFITVVCMILEAFAIGFFEEMVFRGIMLPMFLHHLGRNKRGILLSVVLPSVIFGLFHLSNIFAGSSFVEVLPQVVYTTIIGIAFSAILLRTNMNLLWCCLLHGVYDMVSGFGDFTKVSAVNVEVVTKTVSIWPYLLNAALFIPLLIYSLLLLKKVDGWKLQD